MVHTLLVTLFLAIVMMATGCESMVSRSARNSMYPEARTDAERAVIDNWADQTRGQLRSAGRGNGSN